MSINVVGFKWDGNNDTHKYDYEALENLPHVDIGMLSLDTSAGASTDDGALYAAITALNWTGDIIEDA